MTASDVTVCRLDDVPDGGTRRVEFDGKPLVVVRIGDQVKVLHDTCSHDDYSLAAGEVDTDECTIECWKHGSLFDLDSGVPVTLPATRPVAVYSAEVVDGEVRISGARS